MARPPNPDAPRKLLEAAREHFARVGVDAARIQDIAEAAGFSKAAFYLYFDSKEAAFARLIGDFFALVGAITDERHAALLELAAHYGPMCEDDWRQTSERWRAYVALDHKYTVIAFRTMWENRDVVRCILEQTTGPRRALVDTFVDMMRRTLAGRLAEGVRIGFLRSDIDPDLASDLILGVYLQLGYRMVRLAEPPDFDAWARTVDTFISEGLGCRAAPRSEPS